MKNMLTNISQKAPNMETISIIALFHIGLFSVFKVFSPVALCDSNCISSIHLSFLNS